MHRGIAVGLHEERGIGVLDMGQSGSPLEAGQLLEFQAGLLTDLTR